MTATETMKLFFFLLLLVSVQSQTLPKTTHMQYALRWAPTFCRQASFKCKGPIPQLFALHGVWPTDSAGNEITTDKYNCGNREPSNWPSVLIPRENELNMFWADFAEGSNWNLWKQQWRKHGACATTVTVNGYFDGAIQTNRLFKNGNLYWYMSDNRVSAGNSVYTQAVVVSAAQKVFGTNPRNIRKIRITCTPVSGITTYVYLKEVYFCTDVHGRTFVDCPGATSIGCSNAIMLPTLPPPPTTTHMQYVLRWAPTFCSQTTLKCRVPIPRLFALHGVWPTDSTGEQITTDHYNCGNREPSNWGSVLKPKEKELNKFWEDLAVGSNSALWKHQWRKHGACATTGTTVTVNGYFDGAIETNKLFKNKNLYGYMSDSGVHADGAVYTQAKVVSAAQKVFGTNPRNIKKIRITCTRVATHVYLKEVYFCTQVNGRTFIDCPGATSIGCSDAIMLPAPPKVTVYLEEAQGETIGTSYI